MVLSTGVDGYKDTKQDLTMYVALSNGLPHVRMRRIMVASFSIKETDRIHLFVDPNLLPTLQPKKCSVNNSM